MANVGRSMACFVLFLFVAAGAIVSATRFAASADAQQAPAATKTQTPGGDLDDAKSAGQFRGRVTGPDGKPIRDARVYVAALEDGLDRPLAVRARTDAEGRFSFQADDMTSTGFDGLPTRRNCIVSATAVGYGPDWIARWGRRRFAQTDLALQLARDDVPIHGRFLGPDGRPVAGARVHLTGLSVPLDRDLEAHLEREEKASTFMSTSLENWIALPFLTSLIPVTTEARTDAEGRFTMSGLGRDRLAQLEVSTPSVLEASLTDSERRVIQRLVFESPRVVDMSLEAMTRKGPDVLIRLGDRDPRLAGFSPQVIHGAGFTIQMKRGRTISGVVRDRDSHQPIAGMLVGIGRDNPFDPGSKDLFPRDGVMFHQTVTDAKGRFTITGLDPGIARRAITAASAPGMATMSASVFVEGDAPALIECPRGIPFRLKLVDEQGRPVLAKVTYNDVAPNPHAPRGICDPCNTPLSRAARDADGTYRGFVVPGPGAVLVEMPGRDYRAAHVDPKAFFAPGRTEWTAQEQITAYGTKDTLVTSIGLHYQDDYAAIVLVNPKADSGPLELSATVVRTGSRRVSLVDPDGKPVVGVRTKGMTLNPYAHDPILRAAAFPLTRFHPDRVQRITFLKEDRQLIGFLETGGDGDAPFIVRMQPWAAVTGRIVDEDGQPFAAMLRTDCEGAWHAGGDKVDEEGRFRIDRLVPGRRSTARIERGDRPGTLSGTAFEKLVLRPGEVRELGEIRIKSAVDPAGRGGR